MHYKIMMKILLTVSIIYIDSESQVCHFPITYVYITKIQFNNEFTVIIVFTTYRYNINAWNLYQFSLDCSKWLVYLCTQYIRMW